MAGFQRSFAGGEAFAFQPFVLSLGTIDQLVEVDRGDRGVLIGNLCQRLPQAELPEHAEGEALYREERPELRLTGTQPPELDSTGLLGNSRSCLFDRVLGSVDSLHQSDQRLTIFLDLGCE
jgi:hypothetical protein